MILNSWRSLKFGKVISFPLIQLSKSFNHSISHSHSHNNQINNQNYLFNITFQNLEFWDVIEGVPNSLLWVSYEGTFLGFGFELIRLKLFHISIAAPNLRNDNLGFLPNHRSYGVVSTDLYGALFNVNAAVPKA